MTSRRGSGATPVTVMSENSDFDIGELHGTAVFGRIDAASRALVFTGFRRAKPGSTHRPPQVAGNATKEAKMNLTLNFDGYWPMDDAASPRYPGIYCIYAAPTAPTAYLLYIGEAQNIGQRISTHEKRLNWLETARYVPLYLSACRITVDQGRRQAEAAMIYYHKPRCNIEFKTHFPFGTTTIRTTGDNANLSPGFTIR